MRSVVITVKSLLQSEFFQGMIFLPGDRRGGEAGPWALPSYASVMGYAILQKYVLLETHRDIFYRVIQIFIEAFGSCAMESVQARSFLSISGGALLKNFAKERFLS